MKSKTGKKRAQPFQQSVGKILDEVGKIMGRLEGFVRLEPTCIKCGCTEYNACDEGCSWTFLNKKTNEGVCSVCVMDLAPKAGSR